MIPMPGKPVEFDPRAVEEFRAARRWYGRRSPAVAERFLAEPDRAVERVREAPGLWPVHLRGTRAVRLGRFPYLLVFREAEEVTRVLAVAHTRRRPGYWRRREP
jgi:plasmid stabilization system protein ParE